MRALRKGSEKAEGPAVARGPSHTTVEAVVADYFTATPVAWEWVKPMMKGKLVRRA